MDKLKKIVVTGLGTGYLPIAPGTWGSAAVGAIFLLVAWVADGRWYCVWGTMLIIAILASWGCVRFGTFTEKVFGRKDPRPCTIDEWAGQAITYLWLPLGTVGPKEWIIVAAAGFFMFRFFDIVKIPPTRQAEKLWAGWGILLDDIMAGIYANIACQFLLRYWLLEIV